MNICICERHAFGKRGIAVLCQLNPSMHPSPQVARYRDQLRQPSNHVRLRVPHNFECQETPLLKLSVHMGSHWRHLVRGRSSMQIAFSSALTEYHRPKYSTSGSNSRASIAIQGASHGQRTPPTSPQVWQFRRQFKGEYGNPGGNSWAITGNSGPNSAIHTSGRVPKPEKRGNSPPGKFAFIKLNKVSPRKGIGFVVSLQSAGKGSCFVVSLQFRANGF